MPVSCRNASSSPAPLISMSRDVRVGGEQGADRGVGVRAVEHDSLAAALDTGHPGQRGKVGQIRRPASVARIMREPTIALISVVGPVGDHAAVRHQHGSVGVGVGLLEVVGREHHRLAARGERRASSSRSHAGPRRPSPRSARRAPAAPGRSRARSRSAPAASGRRRASACGARRSSPMPGSSSTSSTGSGVGYSEAIIVISSRTDRSRISSPVWSIAPIAPASTASDGDGRTARRVPASGCVRPSSMSIVVDLPAPFGPSSATVSPRAIEMSIPRTA